VLERLDSSHFDWLTWRRGNPADLFRVACRSAELYGHAARLRAAALGWCEGETVPCRPKCGSVAVMFQHEGELGWFHLLRAEFDEIFAVSRPQDGEQPRKEP
jgi:hypothetical protein